MKIIYNQQRHKMMKKNEEETIESKNASFFFDDFLIYFICKENIEIFNYKFLINKYLEHINILSS